MPFKASNDLKKKAEVLKKQAANKRLVDMKKTIDKKTASTQMKKSQLEQMKKSVAKKPVRKLEQMKKSVAKKPVRKSLGGGTSRRASY